MIQLGLIRIHLLNDGCYYNDAGGPFGLVPRTLWKNVFMPPDENNLLPMRLHSLLVQVGDMNIVVDTGYGTKLTEKQQTNIRLEPYNDGLLAGLARLGVAPSAVHMVIDTHLHGDHAGGNTLYDADGQLVPTFPNAEYVVQRREYEDAMHPNERTRATYLPINYQLLYENGQLRLLDGDTELAAGISGHVTRGHTPGHMSVRLESDGQHAAFLCDMASYAIHFERLAWMTAYDVEPLETLETKRRWQQWALQTNALLIFPHDPLRPMGRLTQDEKGNPRIAAVDEPYA
ncbi:MAG: MBL fold metallo-hydrolase [Burkholderiales bacterium]|nr:MBL fold metallo-hydrolase [Anaerolineae bacterium]